MAQYTNSVTITMNATKTEVFMSFSQDRPSVDEQKESTPVSDLVMTGELAAQMLAMLTTLFATPTEPQDQKPK